MWKQLLHFAFFFLVNFSILFVFCSFMGGLFETRSSFSQPFLAIPIIFVLGYIFRSFEKRLNFVSSYVEIILNLLHNNNNNRVGTISQSSSETPFKLFRFTVGLSHLEKLSFAQASAYIASANAKKWKSWIFGPSTNRVKNQNYIIL